MANLQYIGARYVPKFYVNSTDPTSCEWEANKSYESLTVVTYLGDSYTSRIGVPATTGNPASNPTYWAKTGEFNAAILSLQSTVNNLDNRVTALEGTNDYIVFIGDSYTAAGSLDTQVNFRYSTQLAHRLGMTEKNYAVGGSSFLNGRQYELQVQDAIDDFTTNNLDISLVKYFVIGGTRNDGYINSSLASSYATAVKNTLDKIKNNFINAKIFILPYLWDYTYMPTTYLQSIGRLKAAIEGQGDWYQNKVKIVDNCYTWLSGAAQFILYQSGANIHPNVNGHAVIATHAYSAIMGNNYTPQSFVEILPAWHSDIDTNNVHAYIDKTNNMVHVHVDFKVANQISGSAIIFEKNAALSWISEFYIGDQRFYITPQSRDGLGDIQYIPHMFLVCVSNKTGDNTGTLTLQLKNYNGNLKAGATYHFDLIFKNGVLENAGIFE